MHRTPLALTLLLSLATMKAGAQVRLRIELGLPVAPPLVVIQPGVQVVEGFGEEVFFHNGWYWCRRPDGWYRARSPRARFGWVEERRVPRRLVEVPRGHYRNWHHDRPVERWETRRHEGRREEHRREERREEHRREERREEHRREERREDRREERRDQRKDERKEERRGERHDEKRNH